VGCSFYEYHAIVPIEDSGASGGFLQIFKSLDKYTREELGYTADSDPSLYVRAHASPTELDKVTYTYPKELLICLYFILLEGYLMLICDSRYYAN
jgi:hypothetical protein